MESDTEGTLSPMLLEDSPPPDKTKKRAWPRRLQIPLGILIVGLVSAGVFGFLSFTDSKDVERVKAGNFSLGDFQERDRQNLLSTGGKRRVPKTIRRKVLFLSSHRFRYIINVVHSAYTSVLVFVEILKS